MRRLVSVQIVLSLLFNLAASSAWGGAEGDRNSLRACLKHWSKHPFDEKNLEYRTLAASVKVFGIGGTVDDDKTTRKPELILVKPSVNVFSKGTFRLMNPNGWYCLKGKVAVFSKVEIQLHCKSNLASSRDGATVLSTNEQNDGVTVFGKSEVNRIGCG